ncbi:MAG: hypothetical protein NZM26_04390 [Patescibacteria group bacterium]|nr:hypothetical protein [Patescibacteria group bacterium]
MIESFDIFKTTLWDMAKVVVLLFLGMYIIFAGVVIKQVANMNETLDFGLGYAIKLVAIFHFCFAVFVFVFSFLIL